jgi:hypothetical protein
MSERKYVSLRERRDEMLPVARGERAASQDAPRPTFESAEAEARWWARNGMGDAVEAHRRPLRGAAVN